MTVNVSDTENYPKSGKMADAVASADEKIGSEEPEDISYKPKKDPVHKVAGLGAVGASEPDWPKGGSKSFAKEGPAAKGINYSAFDTDAPSKFQMGELRTKPSPIGGKT